MVSILLRQPFTFSPPNHPPSSINSRSQFHLCFPIGTQLSPSSSPLQSLSETKSFFAFLNPRLQSFSTLSFFRSSNIDQVWCLTEPCHLLPLLSILSSFLLATALRLSVLAIFNRSYQLTPCQKAKPSIEGPHNTICIFRSTDSPFGKFARRVFARNRCIVVPVKNLVQCALV